LGAGVQSTKWCSGCIEYNLIEEYYVGFIEQWGCIGLGDGVVTFQGTFFFSAHLSLFQIT